MANWKDIGGLPMTSFVTFACLISGDNLWFYGYKPDGSQWYCREAIKKDSDYLQLQPFVPYIGTKSSYHRPGNFSTCYQNVVYLNEDDPKISGKKSRDNPEVFGGSLLPINY